MYLDHCYPVYVCYIRSRVRSERMFFFFPFFFPRVKEINEEEEEGLESSWDRSVRDIPDISKFHKKKLRIDEHSKESTSACLRVWRVNATLRAVPSLFHRFPRFDRAKETWNEMGPRRIINHVFFFRLVPRKRVSGKFGEPSSYVGSIHQSIINPPPDFVARKLIRKISDSLSARLDYSRCIMKKEKRKNYRKSPSPPSWFGSKLIIVQQVSGWTDGRNRL